MLLTFFIYLPLLSFISFILSHLSLSSSLVYHHLLSFIFSRSFSLIHLHRLFFDFIFSLSSSLIHLHRLFFDFIFSLSLSPSHVHHYLLSFIFIFSLSLSPSHVHHYLLSFIFIFSCFSFIHLTIYLRIPYQHSNAYFIFIFSASYSSSSRSSSYLFHLSILSFSIFHSPRIRLLSFIFNSFIYLLHLLSMFLIFLSLILLFCPPLLPPIIGCSLHSLFLFFASSWLLSRCNHLLSISACSFSPAFPSLWFHFLFFI